MQAEHFRKILSARKICWVILITLILSIGTACSADKQISKIEILNQADKVVINLNGNFPLKYTVIKSSSGLFTAFQFAGKIVTKGRVVGINSGKIWNVKYSNFSNNPLLSRVVVNTKSGIDYSTNYSETKKHLSITIWKNKRDNTSIQENKAKPLKVISNKIEQIIPKKQPNISFNPITEKIAEPTLQPIAITKKTPIVFERNITVNFLNADINDVLKALSIQSGKNIVSSKDVSGNVTVSLTNVSLEEALDYVAKLSGYSYTKAGETYLVASRKTLDDMAGTTVQENVTETVRLSYAKSDDVIALVAPRYPDVRISKIGAELTGLASMDASGLGPAISLRNNLLVLTGPKYSVAGAKTMIESFEASFKEETVQGVIKIYKIQYVNPTDLARSLMQLIPGIAVAFGPTDGFDLLAPKGVKLDSAGSQVVLAEVLAPQKSTTVDSQNPYATAGPDIRSQITTVETAGRARSIIIAGRAEEVEKAFALASQLDVKFPQVKIEAKITSITESAEKQLGFLWEWDTINFLENQVFQIKPGDEKPTATDIGGQGWNRQMTDFAVTLEAMATNGDINILATPSLTLLEGKPGVFFVGDDVTYISFVETTATGKNIRTESKQVGIQLRAISSVSPDGFITLNLHPEVSVLKLIENTTAGMSLPIVTTRFTDHTIRVKSGDTFAIGGLIRSDDVKDLQKVPILGDIPIIGELFKHSSTSKQKTEVVMFLKVTIMDD